MCGIAGAVNLSTDAPPVTMDELRTMAGPLVHRGPDDEGYYVDPHGRCGLAFRRLAIIDPQTGNQPLHSERSTTHVVFNGEIYNFRALRRELEDAGHRFATGSDGEVIVHGYEQAGRETFQRLTGMFALAIWDEAAGALTLARDRFGQKPLVYAVVGDRLYFASELKAIVALPGVRPIVDSQSVHRYLLFQYVPAPHAIYRGFHKLPPGTWLHVVDGAVGQAQPYWRIPRPEPYRGSYEDAKAQLGERLTASVEKRLIADVPLGAFLSGGIDSSVVVALMRKLGVAPLRTFSIGFSDARYDESRYARLVAERFETEHHARPVTPEAQESLETLAYHYDEPFADSSAIPTLYLSRWTRESVTVALTGDAGDEGFAGYDRYRAAQLAARLDAIPRPVRRALASAAVFVPHGRPKTFTRRLYRFLSAVGRAPARRYLDWIGIFKPTELAAGYRPEFAERLAFDEPVAWFEKLYHDAPGPPANRAVYTDLQSYLPYDLLTKVDIASMACSLECRCPLLDHDLITFALSLPLAWRLGPGGGKRILRDWAADVLPREILHRPKMGFGVPVGEWFRTELRDRLETDLLADDSVCASVFRREWLRARVDEHLSGHANHEHALWSLLMLELWGRRWQPRFG